MAVKLRMTRIGRRHRPFFRINVIDSRTPRDGRVIEKLGQYDPLEKDKDKQILLNKDRAEFWLAQGAIPSDTVSEILLRFGIKHKYADEKAVRVNRARKLVRAKGQPYTKAEREAASKAAEAKPAEGEKKA
jgi:small subunit ribosomal protein S16